MHGDKGKLKTAGKKAQIQQPKSLVAERFCQRLLQRLLRIRRKLRRELAVAQFVCDQQRGGHDASKHKQGIGPSETSNQFLGSWHHEKLYDSADGTCQAEGPAALRWRHNPAQRAVHRAKCGARKADADQHPRTQGELGGSRGNRHER